MLGEKRSRLVITHSKRETIYADDLTIKNIAADMNHLKNNLN